MTEEERAKAEEVALRFLEVADSIPREIRYYFHKEWNTNPERDAFELKLKIKELYFNLEIAWLELESEFPL